MLQILFLDRLFIMKYFPNRYPFHVDIEYTLRMLAHKNIAAKMLAKQIWLESWRRLIMPILPHPSIEVFLLNCGGIRTPLYILKYLK